MWTGITSLGIARAWNWFFLKQATVHVHCYAEWWEEKEWGDDKHNKEEEVQQDCKQTTVLYILKQKTLQETNTGAAIYGKTFIKCHFLIDKWIF